MILLGDRCFRYRSAQLWRVEFEKCVPPFADETSGAKIAAVKLVVAESMEEAVKAARLSVAGDYHSCQKTEIPGEAVAVASVQRLTFDRQFGGPDIDAISDAVLGPPSRLDGGERIALNLAAGPTRMEGGA